MNTLKLDDLPIDARLMKIKERVHDEHNKHLKDIEDIQIKRIKTDNLENLHKKKPCCKDIEKEMNKRYEETKKLKRLNNNY